MNRVETAKIVTVLLAAWPNFPVADPDGLVTAYQMGLDDVPYEVANVAVREWIKTGVFFPRPAELRVSAIDRLLPMPSAEEAWGEVVNEIHVTGMYGTPSFSCAAIWWAVRALDWREICCTERGDLPSLRAHFYRTYESCRQRAIRDADVETLGAEAYVGLAARRRFEDRYEPLRGEPEYREIDNGEGNEDV